MAAGTYKVRVEIPSLPACNYLLRRLDGAAEAAVEPRQPRMATRLLEHLLAGDNGEPIDVPSLPLAVHDRLLAAIYITEFGETIGCRAACTACAKSFEFRFPLPQLLTVQDEGAAEAGPLGNDGFWDAPDGYRVRPPTLNDADAGADLMARIATPAPAAGASVTLAAFLEQASPLLSLDIDTACPECGTAQAVWFDLARFLVQSLAGERPFLIRETHLVAARYGWSHKEIMALPRDDRRAYAALIESERSASLRRAS